jgi:Flp pilus assembly pilin Flp
MDNRSLVHASSQRRGVGQRGQTMGEYAVVLALITVVIVAALGALAIGIEDTFDAVTGVLP